MTPLEEFFGNLTIDPDFFVILDLDSVENIAHPFWEFLDPNPDIHQLFNRFNNLFFDGTFTDEHKLKVNLQWFTNKRGPIAAQTWPANTKRPCRIEMNERILKTVLRREIIETLIVSQMLRHVDLVINPMRNSNVNLFV